LNGVQEHTKSFGCPKLIHGFRTNGEEKSQAASPGKRPLKLVLGIQANGMKVNIGH